MADTSLNENRIGLLIWQTSNLWQSKLRNKLSEYNISFNEYLIMETIYNLSKLNNDINQVDIVKNSFIDKSVVSAKLTLLPSFLSTNLDMYFSFSSFPIILERLGAIMQASKAT